MTTDTEAETARRGLMFVLSSPSGAGKSTISRALLKDPEIVLSVSVTTRERRPSEIDGVHYKFISVRQFQALRDQNELLEWAVVHGNFYGTPCGPVEDALASGRDVLFDIDYQGTQQLSQAARVDVVSVFILPPSMAELRARLERRAEDSEAVIAERLENAHEEIDHWDEYDYVLINDNLDETFRKVESILAAERLRRERSVGMGQFVDRLKAER